MALDVNLREELLRMDEEFGDETWKLYSGPLLTSPQGIDSSRLNMLTQNLKQWLMILNPDYPRLSTLFENTFGKYSGGFFKLEGSWEVVDKIQKYGPNSVYMLVLYNKETDTYDMIEKKFAEGMSEKQGYIYNTKVIDSLEVGDIVQNEVLYKTTSFDDHMNYRYGKNAKVFATITNDTLEDSIRIRRGWTMGVHSTEIDSPVASVNNNDVPLNLYGDEDNYRSIPDIGESVDGVLLFATRRKNKAKILNDFRSEKLRTAISTDNKKICSKNSILYDLDIYYNGKDPFPDNVFFKQLKWYYEKGCEYARRCYEAAVRIKKSGSNYTIHIPFYKDRFENWNTTGHEWVLKDKKFDFMTIEFHCIAVVPLGYGGKMTGRYGNKGVICNFAEDVPKDIVDAINKSFGLDMIEQEKKIKFEIIDDDTMPFTDDGPIDILLDVTASVRRLIMDSTHEIEINFISNEVWKRLKSLNTFEEKKELFFDFLKIFSEFEYKIFTDIYNSFDRVEKFKNYDIRFYSEYEKKKLIQNVEEHGFYLVKAPHVSIRYREIKKIYEHYPWIKPIPAYINHFGVKHRIMNDVIVGEMYFMFLKQNTNKNFSARSTYRLNRSNLPAKDNAKKMNMSSYAKTPIKLTEIYNIMSMLSGAELAEYNIYMRSSTLGRKSLEQIIRHPGNPLSIKKLKMSRDFINTNAQILNAKLKIIGMRLNFLTEEDLDGTSGLTYDAPISMTIGKYQVYDLPSTKPIYTNILRLYQRIRNSKSIIETYDGELDDVVWCEVFDLDEVKEMNLTEEFKNNLRLLTNSSKPLLLIGIDEDDENEVESDPYGLEEKVKRTRRTKAEMKKLKEDITDK